MPMFKVIAKRWPDGALIPNTGASSSTFPPPVGMPQVFNETAAEFMTDGAQQYQFLFWNTGRRLTRRRSVLWTFSRTNWGTWTATKWYGNLPGGGSLGVPRVRADAFTIAGDAPLSGTPIDAALSTYAAGAYPFPPPPSLGDDHVIGTTAGGANVVAKDPFPGCGILGPQEINVIKRPPAKGSTDHLSHGEIVVSYAVSSCDFAGWLQLVWGGEEIPKFGPFLETDTLSGGSGDGFGVYDHVVSGPFSVPQGNSADIIAAYGIGTHYINASQPVREWIYDVPFPPNPLILIKDLLAQTLLRLPMANDLDLLIKDVPQMNLEELGRVKRALEITFDRGSTALSMIKARMAIPAPGLVACVDFEPPLILGTQYGTPVGQNSGDVAFTTTNGVTVKVLDFHFTGGGGTFNLARIDGAPVPFGSGQSIRTNNINLEFDFSLIGFATSQVQFDFLDLGGFENISVNGSSIFPGELAAAPSPIGGVSISVTTVPVTGGKKGTVTLTGVVKTLKIGGQEFWIDNVCARQ